MDGVVKRVCREASAVGVGEVGGIDDPGQFLGDLVGGQVIGWKDFPQRADVEGAEDSLPIVLAFTRGDESRGDIDQLSALALLEALDCAVTDVFKEPVLADRPVPMRGCGSGIGAVGGTVTLVEKPSSDACLGQAATRRRRSVHFQAAASVAVPSCQTAKRSVISARHSVAVSRCRRGRNCGEIELNADRNRCACATDLKRFIARSRCLVG